MKPIHILNSFGDSSVAKRLFDVIKEKEGSFCFMEVCGTHTVQIFKTGIRDGLKDGIRLISGPGCPVCVTSAYDIDKAIAIAKSKDVVMCCFGDMIKVPGSRESLDLAKANDGAPVKIMYSPLEALELAVKNPRKKVVLFGVGFETTIPAFASVLIRAKKQKVRNLFIFPVFKLIPPALRALLESSDITIDGFILPGHVSTIIGEKRYRFIADEFGKPAVITGFEVVDLLEGILLLIDMARKNRPAVKTEYSRSVNREGNVAAQKIIATVFREATVEWRGLGSIKKSGLKLNKAFQDFDVDRAVEVRLSAAKDNPACLCGNVIKGTNSPQDCSLFAKQCTPEHPVGPCMVSVEGTCSAYYNYGQKR